MARLGFTHSLVWHVRGPTLAQRLIGLVSIRCKADRSSVIRLVYYDRTQEVCWSSAGNCVYYNLCFRNRRGVTQSRLCQLNDSYRISQDGLDFYYDKPRELCDMLFTSRCWIDARIEKTCIVVRLRSNPISLTRKFLRPNVKFDGSYEDAELALRYFLNLRDQLISLGY